MNDLAKYAALLETVKPWCGTVPPGFIVDFTGQITDRSFLDSSVLQAPQIARFVDGASLQTSYPSIGTGAHAEDSWFEAVDRLAAVRDARGSFVMVTLGAWNGHQAVGSYRMLQLLNPMPCKLVAVEPVPALMELTRRHFRNNGLDPDDHWLIPMAISGSNDPVFFAIAPWRMGPQNCFSTNERVARENYCRRLIDSGQARQGLEDLLLRNSTGIAVPGVDDATGGPLEGEIRLVSAVTLDDVLGPFDCVDYLDSDIQESEILVFPPFMDMLKRKVKRIHIGTHGKAVHQALHDLFAGCGWELVFSYAPDSVHQTIFGPVSTGDGVLTVRKPTL